MTVHRIYVSSEERIAGHRGDFTIDTSREFAGFEGRRIMCAVEFCDVVRYSSENTDYLPDTANPAGLLIECPDLPATNSYETWSGATSCALTLLQNYATAGVYGLAHDMPYCRRAHIGVQVDYDFVKRLGQMRFRLRRCATRTLNRDYSLAEAGDSIEPWSFQLVFWEPCECLLVPPFSYDNYRVWATTKGATGSVVDCRVPVRLNSSRSVDTSQGKWFVALEHVSPIWSVAVTGQPASLILACPTLVSSEDRHILAHLGRTFRVGEETVYGQRYSVKPGTKDAVGHELRTNIDNISELHIRLLEGATLEPAFALDYEPHLTLSLIFYRVE